MSKNNAVDFVWFDFDTETMVFAEIGIRSRIHEIQENWKPACLSNEEYTHLTLEAHEGFIVVISSDGQIHHVSENVTSLLGHLPVIEVFNSVFASILSLNHECDKSFE